MVIEQQITGAIIAGIKELYGAEVPAAQIQLQKTKKEFKGHLTLVVFPFLPCVEEITGTNSTGNRRIFAEKRTGRI